MVKDNLRKILALLITSKVRVKIITLFFTHPRDIFHMRQIARLINEQINAVRRELINLEKCNFLISTKRGVKKYYAISTEAPFFTELRSIFVKSYGLGYLLFLHKKELGNIKFAVLTHTYLNREDSSPEDPDLLIVGEPDRSSLSLVLNEAEAIEEKKIYCTIMSEKDFELAKKRRDLLIYSISVLPRSMIIGRDEDFVL